MKSGLKQLIVICYVGQFTWAKYLCLTKQQPAFHVKVVYDGGVGYDDTKAKDDKSDRIPLSL